VSNDGLHAYLERSGTVKLEPGFHAIRIEYFEYGGDEKLSVQMKGPGLSRGPIPPSKVFLEKILR